MDKLCGGCHFLFSLSHECVPSLIKKESTIVEMKNATDSCSSVDKAHPREELNESEDWLIETSQTPRRMKKWNSIQEL